MSLESDRSPEANLDEKFLSVLEQLPNTGCSIIDPVVDSVKRRSTKPQDGFQPSPDILAVELVPSGTRDPNKNYTSESLCKIFYFNEEDSQGIFTAYDLAVYDDYVKGTVEFVRLNNNGTLTESLYEELTSNINWTGLVRYDQDGIAIPDTYPARVNQGIVFYNLKGENRLEIFWNGETFENIK